MSSEKRTDRSELPVWLYIGVLLFVYGVLLSAAGLYQLSHPPDTVLARYHPTLWGGAVLLVLGGCYTVAFRPRESDEKK